MTGAIEGPGRTARETVLLLAADRRAAARLTAALRWRGFGVLTPRDPAEALALARAVRPSVALVDLRSTGMRFVCERLEEDDRCGGPALVLLVPPGVTPVPWLVSGRSGDVVEWDAGDLAGTVVRIVAIADRQRDLRAASPLTGLPGNAAIRAELERRVAAGQPLALLYFDLDSFKPYNDHHGFLRGDDVLRTLAGLLVAEARRHPDAFVGHVGGDDFVVVLPPEAAAPAARRIVEAFDTLVPHLYAPAEAARGWISGHDRLGRRCRWPLLSLSVGVARSDRRAVGSALELVDVATEMKRVAKGVRGSAVAVDQRSGQRPGVTWRLRALATAAAAPLRRAAAVVVTLAVAAVLFVPAGSALALAKPGEFLWPAARLLEDARLALADSETAFALRLELAAERLAEAVAAFSVGEHERAAAALGEYGRRSGEAAALLATVDAPAREAGLSLAAEASDRQARILSGLVESRCEAAGDTPEETCVALRAALATVAPVEPDRVPAPGGTPSPPAAAGSGEATPHEEQPTGRDGPAPAPTGSGEIPQAGAGSPGGTEPTGGSGGATGQPGTPAVGDGAAGPTSGATGTPAGTPPAGTPPVGTPDGSAATGSAETGGGPGEPDPAPAGAATEPAAGEDASGASDPPATGEATTPAPPAADDGPGAHAPGRDGAGLRTPPSRRGPPEWGGSAPDGWNDAPPPAADDRTPRSPGAGAGDGDSPAPPAVRPATPGPRASTGPGLRASTGGPRAPASPQATADPPAAPAPPASPGR